MCPSNFAFVSHPFEAVAALQHPMLLEAPPTLVWLDGPFLLTTRSSCSHNRSLGSRSDDCAGHSIIERIPAHSLELCFGSLSCCRWTWAQSSAVHRLWHDIAKWSGGSPSSISLLHCTNLPLYHHQHTPRPSPPPCLTDGFKHHLSSSYFLSLIFSVDLRLPKHFLCDSNTSNVDLSIRNTFSPIFFCPVSVFFCPS